MEYQTNGTFLKRPIGYTNVYLTIEGSTFKVDLHLLEKYKNIIKGIPHKINRMCNGKHLTAVDFLEKYTPNRSSK